MELFKPYLIKESQLKFLPIKEGQFICTIDTGRIFIDVTNFIRMPFSETTIEAILYDSNGKRSYLDVTNYLAVPSSESAK